MSQKKRIIRFLLIVFFVVILAAGFFFDHFSSYFVEAGNFPLLVDDGGSGKVTYCYNEAGNQYYIATMYISNEGEQPLTLESVTLMDSQNIDVLETSLMKVGPANTLVGFRKYPLSNMSDYMYFDERIPVKQAIIQPGEGYNLIFFVSVLEEEGSAWGQEFVYRDANGKRYWEKSYFGYAFHNKGMSALNTDNP